MCNIFYIDDSIPVLLVVTPESIIHVNRSIKL